MPHPLRTILGPAAILVAAVLHTSAEDIAAPSSSGSTSPERGYEILRTKAFLPPDFDDAVFEKLWTAWPNDLRAEAAAATPARRRELTFERYGLHEPPEAPAGYDGPAIGYVDDGENGWVMNCFACHAGEVAGRVVPGAPNADIDLQSLVEDVRSVKLAQLKAPAHLDLASLKIPLGGTRGTTNSVVFGIILDGLRRPDMSVDLTRTPGRLDHHDMDAPAWWNVRKKSKLYVDAFAPKNHRILMQFMLIPRNDRETIYSWEDDFRDVLAYIESLEPPAYAGPVDAALVARGKALFEKTCADCHGTYRDHFSLALLPSPSGEGPGVRGRLQRTSSNASLPTVSLTSAGRPAAASSPDLPITRVPDAEAYPQKIIPIAELGTDPVRLEALTVAHREHLKTTWMTDYGRDDTAADPGGYVAPPLDGVWASAPYFHNGSVPTLWHVLHPDSRPKVWRRDRTRGGFDHDRIGLAVQELDAVPRKLDDPAARRDIFDTSRRGKSSAGHDYPNALTEDEKRAVLEYLKTL